MSSNMAENSYPFYHQAVILPVFAFPSWILCISPMVWHLSQGNIAAGSLCLWLIVLNFFNSINPIIWPRDNMEDWWSGEGLCDIQVRIQVGAVVSLAACGGLIVRRLANVMDTRNITVAPSRRSVLVEKIIEITFCWVYPAILMITYYVVQPFRYFLFGISGCVAAYDSSWPSLALIWVWGCISSLVAAFYSGLLAFRLIQYRHEFYNLIAARNTTKSRFIRLFLMSIITTIAILPYSFYIFYELSTTIVGQYDWDQVHGSDWNKVIKVPSNGSVRFDRWGDVIAGYMIFILFGTGSDAHKTYRVMLTSVGFGKIFPSLYIMSESRSGASTSSSVTFGKRWTSVSSKARSLFGKNGSTSGSSRNESIVGSVIQPRSRNVSIAEPILSPSVQEKEASKSSMVSFFSRVFNRRDISSSILPVHYKKSSSTDRLPVLKESHTNSGFSARAWATDDATTEKPVDNTGVHVVREVHQAIQNKGKEKISEQDSWA